jgi:hypothetical protein
MYFCWMEAFSRVDSLYVISYISSWLSIAFDS